MMLRKLFSCKPCVRAKIIAISHLPFWQRIFHKNARRTIITFSSSVMTILLGSFVASLAEEVGHGIFHYIVDALGYSIHGLGLIPFVRYAEPFWTLMMGATEEIIELEAVA